ncbi:hypothetical protein ABZ613_38255 [Streptomyces collinus]|uniref:hypothetical protein n=1 Tax=Streptomyces collinus TaxID=42684 RepID=UPI0033F0E326
MRSDWQFDPGRRPEGYTTDLVLTSRRLLILGIRTGTLGTADVVAITEGPLSAVPDGIGRLVDKGEGDRRPPLRRLPSRHAMIFAPSAT